MSAMQEDILAVTLGEDRIRIIPPTEADTEAIRQTKYFLVACLHRRNMDENFSQQMAEWVSSVVDQMSERPGFKGH